MKNHCRQVLGLLAVTVLVVALPADEKKKPAPLRSVKLGDITLKVPVGWKQEKPRSRLRAGQFSLPPVKGDKEAAELAIFFFGGAGGGADANISRWVGQFQSKGRVVKAYRGTSSQGVYLVLDLSGTYNKPIGPPIQRKTKPMPGARMLAVILAVKGKGNYFLKLTGPRKTVTSAEVGFRKSFGADLKKEKPIEMGKKKAGKKKAEKKKAEKKKAEKKKAEKK